jgi:LuxR family transcriptional regulator, maltose regulon positive regulatory protein
VLLRLAELRRMQGRLGEAAELLSRAGEAHPLATLGRAALALEREDAASAVHLARRVLRTAAGSDHAHRAAALNVLLRALLARGERPEARSALDELRGVVGAIGTEAMAASVLVAEGLVAASGGAYDRARDAFEDASALLVRSGASYELACCRVELGRALAALGRREPAEVELHAAALRFEALGAARRAASTAALRRELAAAVRGPGREGPSLTRRELEVLRLVGHGLTNRLIAKQLVVSEFTVKRHVANVLAKLAVPSRAAAAAYAARAGLQ